MESLPARQPVAALMMALFLTMLMGCSGSSDTRSAASRDASGSVEREPAETETPPSAESSGPPSVSLTAAQDVVATGGLVDLSWNSAHADQCSASGGWTGDRATDGSMSVGPISASTTYTLTCSGPGGNAVAMLSVSVLGTVTLSWQPPNENVDGTPLNDLAGYRIYYGVESRDYDEHLTVTDDVVSQDIELASGSYYFAMTAMDADGNESAYSNELIKVVN